MRTDRHIAGRRFFRGALILAALSVLCVSAAAEIVYLKNGDVIHGEVTGANSGRITVTTAYGKLVIPKTDILRIEYEPGDKQEIGSGAGEPSRPAPRTAPLGGSPELTIEIRGNSFWYAFKSPPEEPADTAIRLRLYLGETEAVTLMDAKPDTVDKNTWYNSFTFSPTDSKIVGTAEGYSANVEDAEDGRVVLKIGLPPDQPEGQLRVRMAYQVNLGSRSLPEWGDAVSRSFSIPVRPGRRTHVVLEQNADGLEYSGLFNKSMKNLESFSVDVLSSAVEEPEKAPSD